MAQALEVPGNFQYCLSVWARTSGGSNVTLTMAGAHREDVSAERHSGSGFRCRRIWARARRSVTFGAQLDAGASVDLFGMQVEAQLAPSDYKRTGTAGGVYSKARFAEDQLTVTAQGTDVYDAVIRIVNTEN